MKLLNYILNDYSDYDVWDNTFDACVTVCIDELSEDSDEYEKFTHEILKKVDLVSGKTLPDDCEIIADWAGLIERNKEKFRQFSNLYWKYEYEDDDDFAYEWIKEFHAYFGGYVSDSFYKTLYEFAQSLE